MTSTVCGIFRNNASQGDFSAEDYRCGSSALLIRVLRFAGRCVHVSHGSCRRFCRGFVVTAGCTMCCHPYDQSGPVYWDGGCQASAQTRAGSILDGCGNSCACSAKTPAKKNPGATESASPSPMIAAAKTPQKPVSYVAAGKRTGLPPGASPHAKRTQRTNSYVSNSYVASARGESSQSTPNRSKKSQKPTSYVAGGKPTVPPRQTSVQPKKSRKPISYVMSGRQSEGPLLGPARSDGVTAAEQTAPAGAEGRSAETPQVTALASSGPPQTLPENGWTARRSTTDLSR